MSGFLRFTNGIFLFLQNATISLRCFASSWLRIYAIRLEPNVYVVTGGAIKLTQRMQDKEHTSLELEKLNKCKEFLKYNGVFDKDSFIDLNMEDKI